MKTRCEEKDFEVGDVVYVPQSERAGRISRIETALQGYGYSSGDNVVTQYIVAVPFINIRDTGSKTYSAAFGKGELRRTPLP